MPYTESHPLAVRIKTILPPQLGAQFRVCAADLLPSTNTELKTYAASAANDGLPITPTVLLARAQNGGRGRMGRSFHSPGGTGLYMSVLLTPDMPPQRSLCLTTAAAVACAEAADALRGADTVRHDGSVGIKWVNDLYLGGKKVAGILAEAALTPACDALAWAVIGIGINVLPPKDGFPDALGQCAGALLASDTGGDPDVWTARLASDILCRLTAYLDPSKEGALLSEYRRRSVLNGRAVLVRPASSLGGEEIPAVVLGIDDHFGLRVQYENGEAAVLSSGEVVLRGDGSVQSAQASVHLQ